IRYDNLNYQQVKQAMQEFVFGCAIPTRVGFQTPFLNVTLDIKPPKHLAEQPVIIGGQPQNETYGEFQEEMNLFNKAYTEVMSDGDAKGRVFTFPIPTVNITKDFDWDNPALAGLWEMTAKYGVPYFANFINSEMSPDDARSMCCRLRLDNRELYKRGGGLFGSAPLTGSIGVVTINLPQIGYLSKTKNEFFERLSKLMGLAKESLEIKRQTIENFMEKGLYPYSKHYMEPVKRIRGAYMGNHFSTIGLVGMNEALLNFIDKNIATSAGQKFAKEILDFMREKLIKYQEETGNLYNLEATPAEGANYRLAKRDKEKFPDIITAGEKEPYYTNSTHLPVGFTDDLFEALELQDNLQTKYTGGTVLHGFLGEKISDPEIIKPLLKKVFTKYKLPYLTFTPTFSICPNHGYISGEHFVCPHCLIPQPCEVYSRIVGYIRPVQQWHLGKQEEFRERKTYKL
ncbi:MAG: ribonucleoside triphosphate reductase, partial [Candidatus Parcubacteria bacterium]|nr:ribonucleoside triphosphate reductase [Candidatus Parcubacteria bacterium]